MIEPKEKSRYHDTLLYVISAILYFSAKTSINKVVNLPLRNMSHSHIKTGAKATEDPDFLLRPRLALRYGTVRNKVYGTVEILIKITVRKYGMIFFLMHGTL